MFERRDNEPDYAVLKSRVIEAGSATTNRYGTPIETVQSDNSLRNQSLNINQDSEIGDNPDRYKQHGFYFNADNCIACHACEAACSEKNDNPAHIAFRSVGFVEGGTYPAYQRLNISMACNHCDDPVCLKGCPTRAYTKFAEYGAVLQDPDICFGCGYCTWVCPYNAPQLDPEKGQVTKCNMCVDRLEVGLKPACSSACLGNALDFGVIEDIPDNRSQAKADIPGFPRTDITHPNIRFQQIRTTQREMTRVDQTAIKYHRSDEPSTTYEESPFIPELDPKQGYQRQWNLKKLLTSHENAHIAFTLSAQLVMGAFLWFFAGSFMSDSMIGVDSFSSGPAYLPGLMILVALITTGLYKLNMHLGKPHRFYRGFYNLRYSPVSREIAGVSLFLAGLVLFTLCAFFEHPFLKALQLITGLIALAGIMIGGYFMYKLYRIEARPFWNHINTASSFIGTGLVLGSLFVALINTAVGVMPQQLNTLLLFTISIGLVIEMAGLCYHRLSLKSAKSEGAASFYEQTTTYGYAYVLRNSLLLLSLIISLSLLVTEYQALWTYLLLASTSLISAIIGRALFYVVVIPTTMPGGFFWRNKGFVEHARETGLADMPQMGVVYEKHHSFNLNELITTIKNTSINDKIDQFKRIFSG
ncbi:MAG: dimethyl sulfoxide reductase anchor subunit [gamma proteobacterium symbiont of Bathyaustriella thionipta]|nr:dimethyl sulfoxide reductase anchor subunit [gamma proteobacterium symbiont of Bathyaustriella thionipta]MCU7949252.1 dimethyl sulfoxide reductase anchor subunit [gamma proteobacterium symbiont of Bathyaustriella thionipta]MCU7953676.1 dimethyl sulfoxide reductase anchor subunit [gamma proteobacterium symbiont of Bathyaustriella thionipta]MCU7955840.1 dimethyl sulfoxide reductase anchor subunit [gamma proteobacterium symbiont of Bathyaustriella thionipta]MCU7966932.1 dimethyl sulfoxide reduc